LEKNFLSLIPIARPEVFIRVHRRPYVIKNDLPLTSEQSIQRSTARKAGHRHGTIESAVLVRAAAVPGVPIK
jgi:hypothetical protein